MAYEIEHAEVHQEPDTTYRAELGELARELIKPHTQCASFTHGDCSARPVGSVNGVPSTKPC
ncbi:hypothetical protein GCM10014713_31480 [Streptomyces purpureus]|uniref:Uncharacterized protein n=1 Tax=Streptomyces purpureus TaxID=1951 RepID=A0A918H3V1_9ACTN|nr:hypothetical protein GCM10014713_31480 [Streptomyces purpureus]